MLLFLIIPVIPADETAELPVDDNLQAYEEPAMPDIQEKRANPFEITITAEELPIDPELEDKSNTSDAAAFEEEIKNLKTTDPAKEAEEKKKLKKTETLCKKAAAETLSGNYTAAIALYKEALSLNKQSTDAASGIKKCVQLIESDITSQIESSQELYSSGDISAAHASLTALKAKYPSDKRAQAIISNMAPDIKRAAAELNNRAIISYQGNDLNAALAQWEKALGLAPEDQNIKDYITRTKKKLDAISKLGAKK